MHLDLLETVTANRLPADVPFALDDQLLQGLVFQLTDECKVWFSKAFDVGGCELSALHRARPFRVPRGACAHPRGGLLDRRKGQKAQAEREKAMTRVEELSGAFDEILRGIQAALVRSLPRWTVRPICRWSAASVLRTSARAA